MTNPWHEFGGRLDAHLHPDDPPACDGCGGPIEDDRCVDCLAEVGSFEPDYEQILADREEARWMD